MAWIHSQPEDVQHAFSQSGHIGAVRNMNAFLTTRLREAIKYVQTQLTREEEKRGRCQHEDKG
eukprot:8768008-Heterocapsa_arctica.AAC.2